MLPEHASIVTALAAPHLDANRTPDWIYRKAEADKKNITTALMGLNLQPLGALASSSSSAPANTAVDNYVSSMRAQTQAKIKGLYDKYEAKMDEFGKQIAGDPALRPRYPVDLGLPEFKQLPSQQTSTLLREDLGLDDQRQLAGCQVQQDLHQVPETRVAGG